MSRTQAFSVPQTLSGKVLTDAFMGNDFESQSATTENLTLTASTDFLYWNLLEIGATKTLEIPATSTLEIEAYVDQAVFATQTGTAPDAANTFMSQSGLSQNVVLPIATDFLVAGLLDVGKQVLEIPATSTLEIQAPPITAANPVQANQIGLNAITLGYAQTTSLTTGVTSTGGQQVTGLSVTVNIPANRTIKVTAWCRGLYMSTAVAQGKMQIWDGVVGTGTVIADGETNPTGISQPNQITVIGVLQGLSAGLKTYNVGIATSNASDAVNQDATSTSPAFILVEAI